MSSSRNILARGFAIALRNWPAIVWTYAFNVGLAFVFSLPLHNQMVALTEHSLASQRLMSGFDLAVLGDVARSLSLNQGSAGPSSHLSIPIYVLLYFLLVPGVLFCYQTAATPRLSTLFPTGIAYFWRFVRITLISFLVFALVLGPLMLIQKGWATHVDNTIVGRSAALYDFAGILIIGLVAAALRVYFDLVEVYTVQLGLQFLPGTASGELRPDRRVRRALLPAWNAFRRNFVRLYSSFVVLVLLGLSAVIITARIAMHTLAQPHVWPAFLLAQIGLFVMLATRFWQRGAETALAMDFPLAVPVETPMVPVLVEPEVVIVQPFPLEN